MEKLKPDYRLLQDGLLVLSFSAVFCLVISFGAHRIEDASHQVLEQNRNVLAIFNQELEKRISGRRILESKKARFVELLDKGVWADIDKLSWIDQLKEQAERLELPSLKYNLDARASYEPVNTALVNGLTVYATPIFLDIGVIHEGDMIKLVNRLMHAGLGFFSFEQCRIERNKANADFDFDKANIRAACTVLWFEIEEQQGMDPSVPPNETI